MPMRSKGSRRDAEKKGETQRALPPAAKPRLIELEIRDKAPAGHSLSASLFFLCVSA